MANLYSATSLRSMEPGVDECIDIFLERLNELASEGKIFDLQFWMQCYAFDVIGQITVRYQTNPRLSWFILVKSLFR